MWTEGVRDERQTLAFLVLGNDSDSVLPVLCQVSQCTAMSEWFHCGNSLPVHGASVSDFNEEVCDWSSTVFPWSVPSETGSIACHIVDLDWSNWLSRWSFKK